MKRPKGPIDVTTIGNEGRRSKSSGTVVEVVLGVDTHLDVHLAVVLDHLGRRLGAFSVPTTKKGYESLLTWAEGFGPVRCAGVEGTSSYGAGLATKNDRESLKKEARRITESRLREEEARHRQEKYDRRRAKEEKPLTEKVKEVVGVR
jgi:hypothetical protein